MTLAARTHKHCDTTLLGIAYDVRNVDVLCWRARWPNRSLVAFHRFQKCTRKRAVDGENSMKVTVALREKTDPQSIAAVVEGGQLGGGN
jgi:hypothetical protein